MEEYMNQENKIEEDQEIGNKAKDMDVGDLDMEGIKKACADVGKGYVPQEQVILLKESILQVRASNQLRISSRSHKETKRKFEGPTKKVGRKSNKQRIAKAGRRLVESRQYPMIKAALGL